MGWSCAAAAGDTMDRWSAFCVEQTGMQNVFQVGETFYMFEVSRKEHRDGAITGEILRYENYDPKADSNVCYEAGHFRIEPDGTCKRAPAILKGL